MQVEANPQTLLKNKLVAVQADAAAYRAVNTRFAALQTAAAALTSTALAGARKASSSDSSVTASAATTAVTGTTTRFAVVKLASTQTSLSKTAWGSTSADISADPAFPMTFQDKDGKAVGTPLTLSAGDSLTTAVAKINAGGYGVTASIVGVGTNSYRLQLASAASGAAGAFSAVDSTGTTTLVSTTTAADATLDLGGGFTATSSTNTFTNLLPGVSVTVSKEAPGTWVSVSVGNDTDGVGTKVQSMVDAANSLLDAISSYTDAESTSAILKGDSTLRGLSSQILDMVSSGVGGISAASVGLGVTKDGKLTFDKSALTAKLASDPDAVAKMLTSTKYIGPGKDGIANNADDVTQPVGIAAQLADLAKTASDATTGTLIMLAKSQDTEAKDLTDRIADWDMRLALRKNSLTTQFTAMTTALSTLQNQSSWLTSQLASLPSWSQSAKS
jgi:flagellar hook-associated protein 2